MTAGFSIRPFQDGDKENVTRLWRDCDLTRPWNDPQKDIDFCLRSPESALFVAEAQGNIVASVMTGHDGHRGVIYYLAVHPSRQGVGLGRDMMEHAENWLSRLGVWKVNLLIRDDNEKVRDFYRSIGYEEEPRIVMARRIGNEDE